MKSYDNYIAGEWVKSNHYNANVNPSDVSDIIGQYAQADESQTRDAVQSAATAFTSWSRSGIQARCDILDAAGAEILARKQELGTLLAREEGKTKAEGIAETARAGQIFKFFAGETLRLKGDIQASVRPGFEVQVIREPVGVVGIITPWNFPFAIPAWKIAPALACGNTVVFKSAGLVNGCAWALADILQRCGLPAGVFNLVMGPGRRVGDALLYHEQVSAVSFTGSVETGAKVAAACSARGARYQLEMGGKNPLVVLDDADLEVAVDCAVNGAFFSTGQRCTASSRLIVSKGIHDRFVEACVNKLAALSVDHALKEDTHIGPVVDQAQLDQDLRYIQVGKEEGAELVFGGNKLLRETKGFYLSPALFTGTHNAMRINREEIFGPVATVIKVEDYEEAVSVANDTEFGLSAGICTTSLSSATAFKRDSRAGMVMVNLPTAGVDYHVPFGGMKGSSFGPREQGGYAREFYTTVKTAYINSLPG